MRRLRAAAARWLKGMPAPGCAVCVRCALSRGRTVAMSADLAVSHLQAHAFAMPHGWVSLRVSPGPQPVGADAEPGDLYGPPPDGDEDM